MNVPKTGRVWAKGPLLDSSIPTDAVITVSFPDGDPVPMERSGDQIRVLVAGAEATDNPAGTLVLPVEVPPIGVHTAPCA